MDPQVQTLALQLADTAARNTAASVFDRIAILRKTKKNEETINELEQIVNDLLSDKNELTLIAQAYEQELVEVQRLSALRDVTFLEVAQDPDSYERLVNMQAQRAASESGE
jgi:hypothetical protein